MPSHTIDPQVILKAGIAMRHLSEFETFERHAIRCVVEAAQSDTEIDNHYLEFASAALAKHNLS